MYEQHYSYHIFIYSWYITYMFWISWCILLCKTKFDMFIVTIISKYSSKQVKRIKKYDIHTLLMVWVEIRYVCWSFHLILKSFTVTCLADQIQIGFPMSLYKSRMTCKQTSIKHSSINNTKHFLFQDDQKGAT